MISVEMMLKGLVAMVANGTIRDSWHQNFLRNVYNHVFMGNALSTNQGVIVLKAADKHSKTLATTLGVSQADVTAAIRTPSYETTPYQSISIPREVRYVGKDKIAFRFKLDNTVVAEIKALRSAGEAINSAPTWNPQYRLWIVTVTAKNIGKVFDLISRHKFHFDEPLLEYMTLCANSKTSISTFAEVPDSGQAVANICANPLLSFVVERILKGEPV
jgi:hypothetical protein